MPPLPQRLKPLSQDGAMAGLKSRPFNLVAPFKLKFRPFNLVAPFKLKSRPFKLNHAAQTEVLRL